MSIATMTRLAAQATLDERRRRPRAGGPEASGPQATATGTSATPGTLGGSIVTAATDPRSTVQAALETIAAYIPSEALAVYIAAIGVLQPASSVERWFWLGIGLLAVLVFAVLGALDREVRLPTDKLVIVIVLGVISFLAYAGALPDSPFLQFDVRATAVAGIVALALSLGLPRLARIVGVAPGTS